MKDDDLQEALDVIELGRKLCAWLQPSNCADCGPGENGEHLAGCETWQRMEAFHDARVRLSKRLDR